jgi:chorismate synthase
MKNVYGENFRIEIFGASHAPEIGVVIEGVPAGTEIDMDRLQAFMDRRAPGRDEFSTPRKEPDRPVFVSGVSDGVADGTVIKAVIRNTNVRSGDYETSVPRPGHADYPASVKFGESYSFAGGGPFSGRMTAPLCIAGAIAIQLLERRGVKVSAKPVRIGGAADEAEMKARILRAKAGKPCAGINVVLQHGRIIDVADGAAGGEQNVRFAVFFDVIDVRLQRFQNVLIPFFAVEK